MLIPERKVILPHSDEIQRDFSPEFIDEFELELPQDVIESEPEFSLETVQIEGVMVAPADQKPSHYWDLQEELDMDDYYFESYSLDDCYSGLILYFKSTFVG